MIKLLVADIKMLFRNRQALFWNLAFPLMFTVIFGYFFGGKDVGGGTVAFVNNSDSYVSRILDSEFTKLGLVKIERVGSLGAAREMVKRNQADVIVAVPANFGQPFPGAPTKITVYTDAGYAQTNAVVNGFLGAFLTEANYRILNVRPVLSLEQKTTSSRHLGYFDFVLVGLIGMALMNSSIQGLAIAMSRYRESKILKRITTTPLPTWKFITAEVLSHLVVNVVQVAVILVVGVRFFGGHVYGSLPMVFALSLLGAVLFQLIGFFIASVSRTTAAAEGMSTAISVPMMFLAGVFFPVDQLPKWLFTIVQCLPLAPLLRMLRVVALENRSPFENPANITIVLVGIVVMLGATIVRFRMNEE